MLTVGCLTRGEELALNIGSSLSPQTIIYFSLSFSDPAAGSSSAQRIRPTCPLRWSSRSSFAVRKELRPGRSIGSGRRRRSWTNRGRMSSCPGPSRKPGTTGIRSDKQRDPVLSPWSISVELSLMAKKRILNKYCSMRNILSSLLQASQ